MSDKEHLIRLEAKMDAHFATVNGHLVKISKDQGVQEGTVKGHGTQIGWLWGLVTGSIMLAIGALIRSVT